LSNFRVSNFPAGISQVSIATRPTIKIRMVCGVENLSFFKVVVLV